MRLLLFAFLSLFGLACQSSKGLTPSPSRANVQKMVVAVQPPARRSLQSEASLTGEFRPYQQVDLYSKISGYLRKIHVDVGSRLRNGDVVAILDAPELQAEVDQAVAGRGRAESDLASARADVLRFTSAVELAQRSSQRLLSVNKTEAGLVAQQEIDDAVARKQAAESQVAAGQAQVAAATQQVEAAKAAEARTRSMLEYTRVIAPFDGVVIKRYSDPGALIQAGVASNTQALPLVRLADTDRLRLVANVPEGFASLARPGASVTVRVPALKLSFPATLSRFTGNVQQNSRTTEVEIDVANPRRSILPGMVADIVLRVDGSADALTIPVQAVSNLGGNRYVLLVTAAGTIEERQVKTGLEGASDVEVVSGLTGSERMVTSSRTLLRPGMTVDVKTEGASR
jgi:RND family efflux transporter MFP subunit